MVTFWRIFMVLNAISIIAFLVIFVWAGFDIHERLSFVFAAQIPPILMMVIRKAFR